MRAICARGKQAESPDRGKFTHVWWGEEVEEKRDRCCRGQSHRTGAAVPERESRVCFWCLGEKKKEHWQRERSRG